MDPSKRRERAPKARRVSARHKAMLDRLAELLRRQPVERQEQLLRELESGSLADGQTDETDSTDPDAE